MLQILAALVFVPTAALTAMVGYTNGTNSLPFIIALGASTLMGLSVLLTTYPPRR